MNGSQNPGCDFFDEASYSEPALSEYRRSCVNGFMHPGDVLHDRQLTLAEKRKVLASWASDIRAVADAPALRQLDNGAVVRVDEVLAALRSLDDCNWSEQAPSGALRPYARRLRMRFPPRLKSALRRSRYDDDDDPPPCPAMINRAPTGPLSGGKAVCPGLVLAA